MERAGHLLFGRIPPDAFMIAQWLDMFSIYRRFGPGTVRRAASPAELCLCQPCRFYRPIRPKTLLAHFVRLPSLNKL